MTWGVTLVHEVEAAGRCPALRAESEQNVIGRRQGQRLTCGRTETLRRSARAPAVATVTRSPSLGM